MKVQVAALFLGLVLAAAGHAAPTALTAPDLKDDPRWKAAEALTQEQIQASTDRNSLARLADLYNGRDFDRFVWTLERLVALTPNSGELKLQLASVYASRDMKSKAYDTLVHMQVQGFGYDLQGDERFEKVNGTKVWTYIVENLRANAKPFGEGKVAFSLPKGDRLLESLDWDPKRQKFLVGSAREGVVYLADKSGATESFIAPDAKAGLWSVLALRADPERDLLWVLSDGVKVFKGFDADMLGKAWLMKYQLSSGKLLGQYAPPEASGGHILTSLAVGKGGRVYVADAVRREIYQLDGEQLKLLAANPRLSAVNGLSVSGDGNTLYFADPSLGLFGFDLATAKPFAVGHNPERLVVGGVEAMYWYDGCLVIVQPQMVPARVMRLKLAKDGRSIDAAMPLDVAQPAFASLGAGVVVGQDLYFIANSEKALYDSYGVLRDEKLLEPVRVFKSNLRYAWDQPGIGTALNAVPAAQPQGATAGDGAKK